MRYYKIEISGSAAAASTPADDQGSASASVGEISGTVGDSPVIQTAPGGVGTGTPPTPSSPPADQWDPAATEFPNLAPQADTSPGRNITVNKSNPAIPASQPVGGAASSTSTMTFSSIAGGINDPGALDIAFTIDSVASQSNAPSEAHLQIWGIPISMVSQASQLTNKRIKIWGGYSNGLPLANEQVKNQGLLVDGMIFPAWGNWISNNTSFECVIVPLPSGGGSVGGPTSPKNIVHNMPAGTPLGTAIQNALSTAFPGSKINMAISSSLVLPAADWSFHQSLYQYMEYAKALSHSILGTPDKGYAGVTAHIQGDTINVTDGTQSGNTIHILYDDLVGQPTWIGLNEIQVTTVLRGDIGNTNGPVQITLPATLTTMTQENALNASGEGGSGGNLGLSGLSGNYLTFQGTWQVKHLKHIGHFRDPQWNGWVTIINATQNAGGSGGGGGGGSSDPAPSTGGEQTFAQTGEGSGTGSST
jgi:hypothetical protein